MIPYLTSWIQSTASQATFRRSTEILHFHLLPNLQDFPATITDARNHSTLGAEYTLWRHSLCRFLQARVNSYVLGPDTCLSTTFSNILSVDMHVFSLPICTTNSSKTLIYMPSSTNLIYYSTWRQNQHNCLWTLKNILMHGHGLFKINYVCCCCWVPCEALILISRKSYVNLLVIVRFKYCYLHW